MKKWDREIAQKAGVDVNGALMVQFYSEDTRFKIAKAEDDHLKKVGRDLQDVRKTNIKVVAGGDGFIFKIQNCVFK